MAPRRHPSRIRMAAAMLTLCVLTACGSTVAGGRSDAQGPAQLDDFAIEPAGPGSPLPAVQGPAGSGVTPPGGTAAVPPGGTVAARPGAIPPGGARPQAPPAGGGDSTGGDTTAAPAVQPPSQPQPPSSTTRGVTATTIRIGIHTLDPNDVNAMASAFGADWLDTGDSRAAADAVIAHLNAEGGIAGRQIEAVHAVESTSGDPAAAAQAACATLTEDTQVVAVVSNLDRAPWLQFASCLAQHDTVLVSEPKPFVDQANYDELAPHLYNPGIVRGDRWGAVADALVDIGYFEGSGDALATEPRLGIVYWDEPPAVRTLGLVQARLDARGHAAAATAGITPVNGSGEVGRLAQQVQAAILSFRSAGVTHVLFHGTLGQVEFVWFPQAESQGYRPRYALNSPEYPALHTNYAPPAQLRGAVGVGWSPVLDTGVSDSNAAGQRCEDIIDAAGVSAPSAQARWAYAIICNGLFFLDETLSSAEEFTPAGLRAVVDGLGTGFVSTMTFQTRFGPGRYDGVDLARPIAYSEDCNCFAYTGDALQLR